MKVQTYDSVLQFQFYTLIMVIQQPLLIPVPTSCMQSTCLPSETAFVTRTDEAATVR